MNMYMLPCMQTIYVMFTALNGNKAKGGMIKSKPEDIIPGIIWE